MLKRILFFVSAIMLLSGCKDELPEKYQRPSDMKGKLYTQLQTMEDVDSFIVALEVSGYDSIINKTGLYSVFAPTNQAFVEYFANNKAGHKSVGTIDREKLKKMVAYHIVQNQWSPDQLRDLTYVGYTDQFEEDFDEPVANKRETILEEPTTKFYYSKSIFPPGQLPTVTPDSSFKGNGGVHVYRQWRKFVPFFYDEYFNITEKRSLSKKIKRDDIKDYFDVEINEGDMMFAGAKILNTADELLVYADNGIIYKVDKVQEAAKNMSELLFDEKETLDHEYDKFGNLLYKFVFARYDDNETKDQLNYNPKRDPRLYTLRNLLTYNSIGFNPHYEFVNDFSNSWTHFNIAEYSPGILAPSNEALEDFEQNFLIPSGNSWRSLESWTLPISGVYRSYSFNYPILLSYLLLPHLSLNPLYDGYLFDKKTGYIDVTGSNQVEVVAPEDVIENDRVFASNGTFVGINKFIIPRTFKGVSTILTFKSSDYKLNFYTQLSTGIDPILGREGEDYNMFVISDDRMINDSNIFDKGSNMYAVWEWEKGDAPGRAPTDLYLGRGISTDLQVMFKNHITQRSINASLTNGKEFVPTLGGRYLIYDRETGVLSGGLTSNVADLANPNNLSGVEYSYNFKEGSKTAAQLQAEGNSNQIEKKLELWEGAPYPDNGSVYETRAWFQFDIISLTSIINQYSPQFLTALTDAGFYDEQGLNEDFLTTSQIVTLFLPNRQKMAEFYDTIPNVDSFPVERQNSIIEFVKTHFVDGERLFTDGLDYYGNMYGDATYSTRNNAKNVRLKFYDNDKITVYNTDGSVGTTVTVSDSTNIMGYDTDDENIEAVTSVVHVIDDILTD
ncbi:fasciclin domain-containing protein [Bacteroidales bacterium]|nr:fasciclin domain-containing protein [Bacteroidales bacterium]